MRRIPRKLHGAVFGILALLLGGTMLQPQEVRAQTTARPEITRIRFEGNESFPDRQLRNAILTRATECRSFIYDWILPFCRVGAEFSLIPGFYNARIFRNDYWRVHTFYRSQGFRQIELDTVLVRPSPGTVEITFRIQEGEPVRITTLDFDGLRGEESLQEVTRGLPMAVGDRLNISGLQEAADTLVARLQDLGYPRAEIFRDVFIPAGTLEGEVLLDVDLGPRARFGALEITGLESVESEVVTRMLPFKEGDRFSRALLFEGQRNLFSLELFRHAAIEPDLEHLPDTIVPLALRLTEGNARRVRMGAGWNTADCFGAEARWSNRNFLGGARRLILRGRMSNVGARALEDSLCRRAGTGEYAQLNGVLAAEFTQPWLRSPRNTLNTGIFAERQSVPDVYVRESLGLSLSLTRRVGRNTPVTLSYQPQLGQLAAADVFFCTNFLVCNTEEIQVLAQPNLLAPIGLSVVRDRANRMISPSGGYTVAAELEVAGRATASDFDYQRLLAEATLYKGLVGETVLAARLRGGWIGASAFRGFDRTVQEGIRISPPQKRFYAGGANSVRGYAQNQLGPRVVTVGVAELLPICTPQSLANLTCDASPLAEGDFASRPTGGSTVVEGGLELRFPVWGPFVTGAAFADFGQVWARNDEVRLGEMVITPGVGLRYSTPIGPLRLDLAYRPRARQPFPVVTSAIRPWDADLDPESARILDPVSGEPIDWVLLEALARLGPRVSFAESAGFTLRRVQLQLSIGQAF